jgi:signal transduction histidine kinase
MTFYDHLLNRGRNLILSLLLLLSGGEVVSQINADSLLRIAESGADIPIRVDAYILLAESKMATSIIISRRYATQASELSKQVHYDVGTAKSLGLLTWAARRSGDLEKAAELGKEALEAAEKLGDERMIANANYELGAIVQQADRFTDARRWFRAGEPYYAQLKDRFGMGKCLNGIGESYRREKKYDSATTYYDKAAVEFARQDNPLGNLIVRNNRGLVLTEQGRYNEAMDSLYSVLKGGRSHGYVAIILESGHTIATCWMELGNLAAAKAQASSTMEEAIAEESKAEVKACAKILMEIAKREGDFAGAMEFQALYYETETQIGNETYEARFENLDAEIEMRKQQVEISTLQNDRRVRKLWQLLLVVLLGLVFVVIVVLANAYRRNRRSANLLSAQNEQLAELNREKDSLVNIVAHDLKSPLSKVKALSSMISMAGPVNERQQTALGMIGKVISDGERLIQDLLDISLAESTDLDLHFESGETNALLREWMAPHRENATRKHIALEFHPHPTPIPLHSELNYVSRIFDNLLSNAIKYTPSDRKIEVSSMLVGQKLHITVRDQGPGISQEDQQKMFKKFQRLSARPTGGESSTGLGLSIIKTLSQRLHGDILVESKLGDGTKFTLVVPLTQRKG